MSQVKLTVVPELITAPKVWALPEPLVAADMPLGPELVWVSVDLGEGRHDPATQVKVRLLDGNGEPIAAIGVAGEVGTISLDVPGFGIPVAEHLGMLVLVEVSAVTPVTVGFTVQTATEGELASGI
jgi:hypothetical protein